MKKNPLNIVFSPSLYRTAIPGAMWRSQNTGSFGETKNISIKNKKTRLTAIIKNILF